jgi:hypothetical protein
VACCAWAKPAQPGCADGPRRRCHALGAVTRRPRARRRLAYHGVEGTRRWEGCAGQGGKWRGSSRGSGVGGVAERDRRDDILMAEGGWMAASDAPCYPMVLRTGGRSEAEPKWGGWGGESTTVALTSENGRRWWHG